MEQVGPSFKGKWILQVSSVQILFSLIMVLTITLTPSLTTAEERERAAMGGD